MEVLVRLHYLNKIEKYLGKDAILLEEIPSGQEYLYDIIEAMKKGQLIEMTNQSYWRGVLRIYLPK